MHHVKTIRPTNTDPIAAPAAKTNVATIILRFAMLLALATLALVVAWMR
jgi:hypothetical protein